MKIAIIGGGASGMVTAYLLDQQGHQVTVFERQPTLGGHIRTLNKNIRPNHSNCNQVLENGVLEFPSAFHNFLSLMHTLNVELEQVDIGSGLFLKEASNGRETERSKEESTERPAVRRVLSGALIRQNFTGLTRSLEHLRLNALYARSVSFWVKMQLPKTSDFYDQPISKYLAPACLRNHWLKLLIMYSYSMPLERIDNFPAELAIPALRQYIFAKWFRIKGGVYSYIEKIVANFSGEIRLNADIKGISRLSEGVVVELAQGIQRFDTVVFSTPPDQVLKLLADPTLAEGRRFSSWLPNKVQTVLHSDRAMYQPYGISQPGEFDFFQADQGWGYNAALNKLCGISGGADNGVNSDISAPEGYSLAFNLDSLIDPDKILHVQSHHTPDYSVESFHWRDEVVATNGENNTYHAGAYLADGLHEGAVTSAMRVAQLIGPAESATQPSQSSTFTAAIAPTSLVRFY